MLHVSLRFFVCVWCVLTTRERSVRPGRVVSKLGRVVSKLAKGHLKKVPIKSCAKRGGNARVSFYTGRSAPSGGTEAMHVAMGAGTYAGRPPTRINTRGEIRISRRRARGALETLVVFEPGSYIAKTAHLAYRV